MTPEFKRFIHRWVPSLRDVKTWDDQADYRQLEAIFGYPKAKLFSTLSIFEIIGRVKAYVQKEKPVTWSEPCVTMFKALYTSRNIVDGTQAELVMLWNLRGIFPIDENDPKLGWVYSLKNAYRLKNTLDEDDYRKWHWTAHRALDQVRGAEYSTMQLEWMHIPTIMAQYDTPQRLLLLTGLLGVKEPIGPIVWTRCMQSIDWREPRIEHWLTLLVLSAQSDVSPVVKGLIPEALLETNERYSGIISALYDNHDSLTVVRAMQSMYYSEHLFSPVSDYQHVDFTAS